MGISNLIRETKQGFFSAKSSLQKRKIIADTERIKEAKTREGELAKLNAERQKVQRDYQNIRTYNQQFQKPNKAARFAKGLSRVINQGRIVAKGVQKSGKKQGGFSKGLTKTVNSNRDLFSLGSKDPFSQSVKPEARKQRKKVIKIEL